MLRVEGDARHSADDTLAVEEPLEIRVLAAGRSVTVAVTMRTPGHDPELAVGFLHNEGVLLRRGDLVGVEQGAAGENRVFVSLAGEAPPLDRLERHFFTTSACGVCGKAGLETLELEGHRPLPPGPVVPRKVILGLPDRLRAGQGLFHATGGLHAAALFTAGGERVAVREDVGRHNALDKLVGWGLLAGRLPFADGVLLVSGRTSYELVQKALAARVPVVCSVSAPSSLAVEVAERFGITLVGFLRGDRFNVYSAPERVGP
ncbi:MAG TPA: formate dehydrogenase accessory sulfurtransferase FdhD [Thermoanaerobaculia bacterium]|nr:formate dehydrogenase accessory sulfurtransferase FdhD [Thermoanaerobaculia bacterium]